jgi:hypothetical protein
VSSRLRPPKPRVITAMQPSSCGRAAAIPPPPTSTRPVDPDVVPTHGDVIVSEGSGDEVLRGEDVVAHKPVSTNCPPPLRPGPASSCLVTAIDCNETMRQVFDARLATLTTLAKAGQASWCSGEDWIQGGA